MKIQPLIWSARQPLHQANALGKPEQESCARTVQVHGLDGDALHAAALRVAVARAVVAFVREASQHCPVFVDEAYLECSDDFDERTLIGLVQEGRQVCLMRTFSKIYGMAGQRIGYGVMPAEMAAGMEALPQHMWTAGNLNRIGVVGAIASLESSEGYVEKTRSSIKAERERLEGLLEDLGRPYAKSCAPLQHPQIR